jgi:sporulation protein YlmC with PRC-barrel domain
MMTDVNVLAGEVSDVDLDLISSHVSSYLISSHLESNLSQFKPMQSNPTKPSNMEVPVTDDKEQAVVPVR